jgi:hypothetical protein
MGGWILISKASPQKNAIIFKIPDLQQLGFLQFLIFLVRVDYQPIKPQFLVFLIS